MEMTFSVPGATLKMKSVRATCQASPAGPKKDAALKLCQMAERAHLARHEAECNDALDAAIRALD